MINKCVPLANIGYSLEDYIKMFSLHDDELQMNILDCYAGVNSFAAEMATQQHKVIACDPFYEKTMNKIQHLSETAQQTIMKDMQAHPQRYTRQDPKHFYIHHQDL